MFFVSIVVSILLFVWGCVGVDVDCKSFFACQKKNEHLPDLRFFLCLALFGADSEIEMDLPFWIGM